MVTARAVLSLALVVAASGVAQAQPQPARPVAWWSFDDDPGEAVARDRAASINDTIEGRITRVGGVVGRAIGKHKLAPQISPAIRIFGPFDMPRLWVPGIGGQPGYGTTR